MPILFMQRKMSLEEAQEENEKLDIELSIQQKRVAIAKLKEAGLSKENFSSWRSLWHWYKTH